MAAPVIVKVLLEQPIRRGDTQIAEISLRKPGAGELRGLSLQALGQSDVSALLTLIPRISDPALVAHEVDALAIEDLAQIGSAVFDFFLTPAQRAQMATLLGN